jgi:aspartate carbamoyltransferase catalytic subunit
MKDQQGTLHILRADQFNRKDLEHLCRLTDTIRQFDKSKDGLMYLQSLLPHRRAMLYFTQPSTRTFLSFQSACQILGMKPSEIRDSSTSSELKGESIEDSLRTFSSYVDLIIMRTAVPGLCDRIARLLDDTDRPVPIINGGSGPDQHPTQALLDIYTLNRSFRKNGGIDGKTIMMVGDLARGRTVRSLSLLLSNFSNVRLLFSSPDPFRIRDDLRTTLKSRGVIFEETSEFESALPAADGIYMTRIQDEYDTQGESKAVDYSKYHLRNDHLKILKPDAIIMHPLPRRKELDPQIDSDPRARYWRQERNGMWTRVALITQVMGVDHHIVMPDL